VQESGNFQTTIAMSSSSWLKAKVG